MKSPIQAMLAVSCLTVGLVSGACAGRQDPILALSAQEAMTQGQALLDEGKYVRARPYLIHSFEVEPNSATGREALLLAADTFYYQGGDSNYIQAEAKYRDFLNRFPTSERGAYTQYQIGNSLAARVGRPDRQQTTAVEALKTYRELLRVYPTSEYAAQAREKIQEVRNSLAEHEFMVARFYLRFRNPRASWTRLEALLEDFPEYDQKDKALFHLAKAYQAGEKPEDSAKAYRRLQRQYPESKWVQDIPEVLPSAPEPDPASVATEESASGEEEAPAKDDSLRNRSLL